MNTLGKVVGKTRRYRRRNSDIRRQCRIDDLVKFSKGEKKKRMTMLTVKATTNDKNSARFYTVGETESWLTTEEMDGGYQIDLQRIPLMREEKLAIKAI